ncbi:hypothetical protein MLD38_024830 [Melastoma candidum]|uniref:Uncharacterized protein n=1 Tax=Melastoma candidum TaxID=119954 RepID=A0ACB9NWB2_9MYRT|nr:hypothetical protein MLD38_024830 [Melastoma candidum]
MPAPLADSSPSAKTAALPSPWASVVRGPDHDPAPPPPPPDPSPSPVPELTPPRSPELPPGDDPRGSDDNVGPDRGSKPAWKALPNGVVEGSGIKHVDGSTVGAAGGGGGAVMGDDVTWPALSESTRAPSKSLSSDSLASSSKALAEGPSSASQVFGFTWFNPERFTLPGILLIVLLSLCKCGTLDSEL